MLSNIFLLDLKTDKDKNEKNIAMNFCHSIKNNCFDKNLLREDNANNKAFFNDEIEEKTYTCVW